MSECESGNDYKLPPFWADDPCSWFNKTESIFKALNITSNQAKFNMVVMALDKTICDAVSESIIHQPPVNAYGVLRLHVLEVMTPLVLHNRR